MENRLYAVEFQKRGVVYLQATSEAEALDLVANQPEGWQLGTQRLHLIGAHVVDEEGRSSRAHRSA